MKTKLARRHINLLIISICIVTSACSSAYNSIHFSKTDGNIISKLHNSSEDKKTANNKAFIHYRDTIFQLSKLNFNSAIGGQEKGISGEVIPVNSYYAAAFNELKKRPRDRDQHLYKLGGPNNTFLKQTHIFADSISMTEGGIKVAEQHIQKATAYYPVRGLLYVLLIVGIIGGGLIIAIIVGLSSWGGLNLSGGI